MCLLPLIERIPAEGRMENATTQEPWHQFKQKIEQVLSYSYTFSLSIQLTLSAVYCGSFTTVFISITLRDLLLKDRVIGFLNLSCQKTPTEPLISDDADTMSVYSR